MGTIILPPHPILPPSPNDVPGVGRNESEYITTASFTQMAGLIPCEECDESECRTWPQSCEYVNPVFGQSFSGATYKSKWLFPVSLGFAMDEGGFILGLLRSDDLTINHLFNPAPLIKQGSDLITALEKVYPQYQWSFDGTYLYMTSKTSIPSIGKLLFGVQIRLQAFTIYTTLPTFIQLPGVFETNATYENDFSSFLFTNTYFGGFGQSLVFTIQKFIGISWKDLTIITDNTFGQYYPNGSISADNSLAGFIINWGAVLNLYGIGCYRLAITFSNGKSDCKVSEPFNLFAWDCNRAKGTCKFETTMSGKIGDKRIDYLLYDFMNIDWYDSIRLHGFFGYEVINKYLETNLEYGQPTLGKIVKIRDEAIQQFTFKIKQDTPKWVHDRFAVYCLMANDIKVSDYNLNNSDYNIKQLGVIKAGNYEPEYFDAKGSRTAGVTALFQRSVQSVIKSTC